VRFTDGPPDKVKALQYLQQAVDQHAFGATGMKQAPYLDSLHGDPRSSLWRSGWGWGNSRANRLLQSQRSAEEG
jgi:hypothetical protein